MNVTWLVVIIMTTGWPWRVDHSIMLNITWRRFDQSAKQLVVGHATTRYVTQWVALFFTESKCWDLINMQNVLNPVSDRSSHVTDKCRFFLIFSGLSMAVIILPQGTTSFVTYLFCLHLLKRKLIWFVTLGLNQTIALLHVLLIK